jgi:hypothetical protein
MEEIVQEGSQPDPGVTPLKFDTVYARSLLQQYRICLWKLGGKTGNEQQVGTLKTSSCHSSTSTQ